MHRYGHANKTVCSNSNRGMEQQGTTADLTLLALYTFWSPKTSTAFLPSVDCCARAVAPVRCCKKSLTYAQLAESASPTCEMQPRLPWQQTHANVLNCTQTLVQMHDATCPRCMSTWVKCLMTHVQDGHCCDSKNTQLPTSYAPCIHQGTVQHLLIT